MKRDRTLVAGLITMALLRSLERYRPAWQRLFEDPISPVLVPRLWRVLLLPGVRRALEALLANYAPGVLGNLWCRTRYIDEALLDALAEGVAQVVILGAGFDTRPYRIPGIEQTHVFEVDLPASHHYKQKRVRQVLGALPLHVTYLAIDFDTQTLEDVLLPAGFHAADHTFFIWEGVTQYITAEAVDAVLRFVAGEARPGSRIVFTYIRRAIIAGIARTPLDEKIVARTRSGQSPWITGYDPAEIGAFLAARGFTLLEDAGAADYRVRYLDLIGRHMPVYEGERMVLARVGGGTV